MCIIVAKPEGVDFPSEQTLRNCFDSNDDGAGFMFARDKRVYIRKGFMSFDEFIEALKAENIKSNETCIMHFRIGTQGGNTKENCHPFPIPCNEDNISDSYIEASIGMVHNGIIGLYSYSKDSISDTMHFAMDIVSPLYRMNHSFMFDDNALDILEEVCESKLCFINGFGDIATVGEFIEDEGILYSNTSYLTKMTRYSSYNSIWNNYYDNDYDDPYGYLESAELFPACKYCIEVEGCKECGQLCVDEEEAEEYVGVSMFGGR